MWFHPSGIGATCNDAEAGGRVTEEPPDAAASAETWRRQARPWGLKGNWKSLRVPVRSCVEWSVKDWAAESQLCSLSWDCSEAQRNPSSRPRKATQFAARTGSSDRPKSPLWPMNNYWSSGVGTVSLAFHRRGHITSVLLALHHFSNCCHSLMQTSSWITNTDLL